MKIKIKQTLLDIRVLFAFSVAIMLLTDSSGATALALAACVLHECGHLICLAILGDYPYCITLSFFGMRIERRSAACFSAREEIAVALCGPAVNFTVFAVFSAFEQLETMALVNLLVGLFNCLPCCPLDGGRVLFNLLNLINCQKSEKICRVTSFCTVCVMAVCSVPLLIYSRNITLLAVTLYLAAAIKSGEKFTV